MYREIFYGLCCQKCDLVYVSGWYGSCVVMRVVVLEYMYILVLFGFKFVLGLMDLYHDVKHKDLLVVWEFVLYCNLTGVVLVWLLSFEPWIDSVPVNSSFL